MMEKILKKLFDYQRFEQNERLEKLIRETGNRYAAELSDDDLLLVNAAGELTINSTASGKNSAANGGIYHGDSGWLDGKSGSLINSGGGGGGAGAGDNGAAM